MSGPKKILAAQRGITVHPARSLLPCLFSDQNQGMEVSKKNQGMASAVPHKNPTPSSLPFPLVTVVQDEKEMTGVSGGDSASPFPLRRLVRRWRWRWTGESACGCT